MSVLVVDILNEENSGVIVDEKLNFKDHVNCIQKKISDSLELFIES